MSVVAQYRLRIEDVEAWHTLANLLDATRHGQLLPVTGAAGMLMARGSKVTSQSPVQLRRKGQVTEFAEAHDQEKDWLSQGAIHVHNFASQQIWGPTGVMPFSPPQVRCPEALATVRVIG